MKLGIIGAMDIEVALLRQHMEQIRKSDRAGMTFYDGKLNGLDCVVVQCGVGKVNAALCVQSLCDCFEVTHIVNTGVAGSLCAGLDIGDMVISRDAVYHDFDCHVLNDRYVVGQVPGLSVRAFPADETLIRLAFEAAEAVNPGHSYIGTIASGDQFVCRREHKARIVSDTAALCTEMEGAAIAHGAWRNGVPFVILRAISDKADDSAQMDYPTFEKIAAHRCAAVTMALAASLSEGE